MAACQKAGLIVLYEAEDKPYLKMLDTRWQARSLAKYPVPSESDCKQLLAPVQVVVDVVGVVVEDGLTPLAPGDKSPSACSEVNGTAVAYIPLADKTQWGVAPGFLAELEAAYPAVDGPATLREIRAWCISNPAKCKTKTGVTRFLNTWFAKVQNGG